MTPTRFNLAPCLLLHALWLATATAASADELVQTFCEPPNAARPGVCWCFMDGNLTQS